MKMEDWGCGASRRLAVPGGVDEFAEEVADEGFAVGGGAAEVGERGELGV